MDQTSSYLQPSKHLPSQSFFVPQHAKHPEPHSSAKTLVHPPSKWRTFHLGLHAHVCMRSDHIYCKTLAIHLYDCTCYWCTVCVAVLLWCTKMDCWYKTYTTIVNLLVSLHLPGSFSVPLQSVLPHHTPTRVQIRRNDHIASNIYY